MGDKSDAGRRRASTAFTRVPMLAVLVASLILMAPVATTMVVNRPIRGAIYARFSTKFQHSIADQVRICRAWADANGVSVDDRHVFTDLAKTGKTHKRAGLQAMLNALRRDEFEVTIFFATNRLYRKVYRSLQFVEEEIIDPGKRCVFVAQGIDTAKSEFWRMLLQVFSMLDEVQVHLIKGQVNAAHEGLALNDHVWGTIAFGFTGRVVEGRFTRTGKHRKAWAIDPVTAEWVKRIFAWYVHDERSHVWIARELNRQNAPLPPKGTLGRWTMQAVCSVLYNRRYIGDFSYGRTEVRWQNKAGYSRQFKREKPRTSIQREHLRIIDDATFMAAQARLAKKNTGGGRHKGDALESELHVVSGMLICGKHNRPLQVVSGRGYMQCPDCRVDPERALHSHAHRDLTGQLVCAKLAEMIRADSGLIEEAVESCRSHVLAMQEPDRRPLEEMERRLKDLGSRIGFILSNPGSTTTDQAENSAHLARLRGQRAEVEAQIAQAKKTGSKPLRVPTTVEVGALIDDMASMLTKAAGSKDRDLLLRARRIVQTMTGGRIMLTQRGDPRPHRGWLRGTFHVDLLRPVGEALGMPAIPSGQNDADLLSAGRDTASAPPGVQVEIDFIKPDPDVELVELVKALADQNLRIKEIATEISRITGRPISRNTVTKLLKRWYESRDLTPPDGRARWAAVAKKTSVRSYYKRLVDPVMAMFQQGELITVIAKKVGIDINTVRAIVSRWHTERGQPVPDGRTRRKSLAKKSRENTGQASEAA